MTLVTRGANYAAALSNVREQFAQTHRQIEQQISDNRNQVQMLSNRCDVALNELTAAILPELSAAALDRAVHLTGYITLVQNDPLAVMENHRQALSRRVAEIEADRRYRDRLLLRAPRVGMLTREIAELEDFRAPLAEVVSKCEHERLEHLLQTGYGTPDYKVGFWRMSYYTDWRAADKIAERFGTNKTFTEVRAEFLSARDTIAVYDEKLNKLRGEVRLGESLEFEHDDCQKQIENLPQTHRDRVREQLASYLRDIDLVEIGDRLQLEPNVYTLATRYTGMRKQTSYLRDCGQHLLQNTATPVAQTMQSLDRELMKYSRPKNLAATVPAARLAKLKALQQRNVKCQQSSARYHQTSTVVYNFYDYDRGRLDDDFLWWDAMTHSYHDRYMTNDKAYGYFIPEVAQFHSAHPDYHYQHHDPDRDLHDAEALAATAGVADAADSSLGSDIS